MYVAKKVQPPPGSGFIATIVDNLDSMLAMGVKMSDHWGAADPIEAQHTRDIHIPAMRHVAAIKSILKKNGVDVSDSLLNKVE